MKLPAQLIVFITLFSIPFANYKVVQVFGIPIYLTEALVLILLLVQVINILKKDSVFQNIPLPRWLLWSTSLLLAGLLTSILSNHLSNTQFGILKAWFVFPILFGWILFQNIRSFKTLHLFLFGWLLSFLIVVAIAIFYSLSGQFTYDQRLKAFYLSPNHLALFLLPSIFILKYHFLSLSKQMKNYKTWLSILLISLIFTIFILTQTKSYTTLLSIATTMLLSISFLPRKQFSMRKYAFMFVLLSTIITGYIITQWDTQKFQDSLQFSERSSLSSRMMIWRTSIALIHNNPIAGIGPGNFQEKYLEYQKFFPPYLEWAVPQPHNLFLAFWLQTGLLGLFGFLSLLFFWIRSTLPHIHSKQSYIPLISILYIEIIIATMIAGMTDTPYWKNDLAYTFWIIIALGIILQNIQQKDSEEYSESLNR